MDSETILKTLYARLQLQRYANTCHWCEHDARANTNILL